MGELARIAHELHLAYQGDAWHGPSVRVALEGVDVRTATMRLAPSTHTICELVLHMTAWTREVARRMRLGIAQEPEAGDWPSGQPANEAEWNAIVAGFDAANLELLDVVAHLKEAVLDERIGERHRHEDIQRRHGWWLRPHDGSLAAATGLVSFCRLGRRRRR